MHRLIDSDTHVNEPPGLWVDRVPSKYEDLVPHVQRFEQGDAWVMEGVKDPINFGLNAAATLPKTERQPWVRFEDIPSGGWEPAVRLTDNLDALVKRAREFLEAEMAAGHFRTSDARLLLLSTYSTVLAVATEVEVLRAVGMEPTLRSRVIRRRELLGFLRSALVVESPPG